MMKRNNALQSQRYGDLASLIALAVGIASMVALLSVTEVEKAEVKRKFEKIGVNNLVLHFDWHKQQREAIKLDQTTTLKNSVPGIQMVAPLVIGQESISLNGWRINLQVVGVNADFFTINGLVAGGGRLLSDLDSGILRCSLGANVVETMAKAGHQVKPGSTLKIGAFSFMVIGSLKPVDGMAPPVNADNVIFIHSQTAQNIFKNASVDIIQARIYSGADLKTVSTGILKRLGVDKAAKIFSTSGEEVMDAMRRWGRLFIMVFGLAGAVSLVFGGARFLNVLMTRVDRRKVEIIVKKALGVKGFDIQMSYLLEALLLSLITGVTGAVLGVFMASQACMMAGWRFFITGDPIIIGIGTSVIFGLLLGTYPAIRASQLDINMTMKP